MYRFILLCSVRRAYCSFPGHSYFLIRQSFPFSYHIKHFSQDIKISIVELAHKLFYILVDLGTDNLDILVCFEFFLNQLIYRDLSQLRQGVIDDTEAGDFLLGALRQLLIELLLQFCLKVISIFQSCFIHVGCRLQFLQ